MKAEDKKVYPYSDPVQKRIEITGFKTYEYLVPFNYENVNVVRVYDQGELHGMELNPINAYWPDNRQPPADYIEVVEDEPIVHVDVIGSACTPPGYVQLMFEPCDDFYRPDEIKALVAPRMRQNNLWGSHLRADQWATITPDVRRFYAPDETYVKDNPNILPDCYVKADWREFPLTGFSNASFDIPRSKSVKISGGSETPGWVGDDAPPDAHYSFRIIRTTVAIVKK
ncbi:MAG: hypothetical protein ACOX68_07325 [Candidatus Limivicinus sp.]|jgi:hypothetical protein